MATTTLVDSTFSSAYLGLRTDNAGASVTDTTAEEARLLTTLLNPGYISPAAAWQVTAQASPNMTVRVGSLAAKTDYYVVSGTTAGQGNYLVRLDVTSQNVTITAADASQTRTDEIYVVIQDNAYDSSARVLPRIGYRSGTLGGANPGPDGAWTAYALLARITVAPTVTTIVNANISDQRVQASFVSGIGLAAAVAKTLFTTKGDTVVATGTSTPARLGVGSNNQVYTADSTQTSGVKWATPAYTLISEATPSSSATISFTGIAATYKHLYMVSRWVMDQTTLRAVRATFNSDGAGNYDLQTLDADSTTVVAARFIANVGIDVGIANANNIAGGPWAGVSECTIPDYTGFYNKLSIARSTYLNASGLIRQTHQTGMWYTGTAINRIDLNLFGGGNFVTGTVVSLYGLM